MLSVSVLFFLCVKAMWLIACYSMILVIYIYIILYIMANSNLSSQELFQVWSVTL